MKAIAERDDQPCSSWTWCRQSRTGRCERILEGGLASQFNGGCSAQGLQDMTSAHSIAGSGLDPVGQCMAA